MSEPRPRSNSSVIDRLRKPLLRRIVSWILGGGSTIGLLTVIGIMAKEIAYETIDRGGTNQTAIVELQKQMNFLQREDKLLWNTVSPTVQNYDKLDAQVNLLMRMYEQQTGVQPIVILVNPETGVASRFRPPAAADDDDDEDEDEEPPPEVRKEMLKHLDDIEKAKHRKEPNEFRDERMKIQQMEEDRPPQAMEPEE